MNKHKYLISFLIALFVWVVPGWTFCEQQPTAGYQTYLEKLEKCAKQVGVQVVSLATGRSVYEHRSRTPLVPASLVKILTSYAALEQLGPFHHFQTEIWSLHKPEEDVIQGDIWIKSEGDFFLVGEKAWTLARQLKDLGIRRIHGAIRVDNSFFAPQSERICLDGKCSSPYNPVLSPTAMEFNTVTFRLFPGSKVGAPVRVEWFPPGDYVRISNQAVTKGSRSRLQLRSLGITGDGRENYQLSGSLPVKMTSTFEYRCNVSDPAGFLAHSFRGLLQQVGIEVSGTTAKSGPIPPGAYRLLTYRSAPLGDLLYGLNRYSNNFMAEMLLRSMGGLVLGPPGTAAKGVVVIRESLRELGIPEQEVLLDSGSGLSRGCRVSPQAFCRVLTQAYKDFLVAPEFLSSLAMNAHEGTLRKRLRHSGVTVRGKTGTLRNVSGFAGYVYYPGQEPYAVTILLNDVENLWEAKKVMDSFLEQVPALAATN